MAGAAIIPMSNAAVEEAVEKTPSISYMTHVQDKDWMNWEKDGNRAGTTGESLRMEAIKISMENCEGVTLHVKAHIQDHGDREYTITPADVDTIIGTQWEARRIEAITITSEGLHEKGYKLQYQAHVQDIGDQGWKEEGEEAGTRYEQKRLESIQLRIVRDLDTIKANEIAKLEIYDATLEEVFGKDDEAYKAISREISTAITNINSAKTEETVKAIFDNVLATIKELDPTIETTVQQVAEEKAKAIVEANKVIADYETIVPNVEGISENDKNIINTKIAAAKVNMENAKTPTAVKEIINTLTNVIETNYGLELAKTKAINELKPYLEEATEGVKTYINKEIKEINKKTFEDDVIAEKSTALDNVRAVITAQDVAKQICNVYRVETTNETTLRASEKTAIMSEIARKETKAMEAENKTDVENAIEELETWLEKDIRYADILERAEEAKKDIETSSALKQTINANITAIEAYIDTLNAEAKAIAQEYSKEYIEEIKNAKTETEANKIKTTALSEIPAKVAATMDYKEEYDRVMKRLNNYAKVVPTLGLSNLEEVNTYINETKANISNAVTGDEVRKYEADFDKLMVSLKLDEIMAEYDLEQARTNAIKKLEKYLTSDIKAVVKLAKDAIEAIEDEETEFVTVDEVKEILEDTISQINTERFNAAKTEAYNKMQEYADKEGASNEVKEAVRVAQQRILAITEGQDIEVSINNVNKELQKGINAVKEIDSSLVTSAKKEFEKQKTALLEKINGYKKVAEVGSTEARTIQEYINMVNDMTFENSSIQELNDKEAAFNLAIANFKSATKGNAIATLKEYKSANGENEYAEEKKAIDRILDNAISEIENLKVTVTEDEITAAGGEESVAIANKERKEVEAILAKIYKVVEDTAEGILEKYNTLHEAKDSAISALKDKLTDLPYGEYTIKVNNAITKIENEIIKLQDNGEYEETTTATDRIDNIVSAIPLLVKFVDVDGNVLGQQCVVKDSNAIKPADPIKTGYIFEEWYSDESLTSVFNFESTTITADTLVYAKFTETYTVTFDTNGATGEVKTIAPITVKSGEKITKPTEKLEKEGFTFDGWRVKGTSDYFNFTNTSITDNLTLVAVWAKNAD